ncbi:MAG TPA: murein biosynthesis integral membrane protein MurJ [Thermomicrobiales bacterium]|nr:murein biosynthesis integral membrane protein MurJ [Thermomicrobiales bacterium]
MTDPSAHSRPILRSAVVVLAALALTRLLGLVREVVIAARFGTGETYDAYIAAFRLPDLLFMVVMSGTFGTAFIPVFGGFLGTGRAEAAWRLANALLTLTVIALLVLAQVVLLLAGPLVGTVIAPELSPAARDLAVDLTRLLLLSPLLLGLGAAAKGMLEAQEAFTFPALAPIAYNLGIILGAVLLAPGLGARGLALGVVLGAAAHAGLQFAVLVRRGARFRPLLSHRIEGLSEVLRLLGPRLLNQMAGQSNLIVMTNVASRLGEGSISALFYAQHLAMLPHGIAALGLSTVIFPRLSRQATLGDNDALRETLRRSVTGLVFLVLPAAVTLALLREGIVQGVLAWGAFSSRSVDLVAGTTGVFALGLLARALIEPVTRGFFALRDTRTPLVVTVVAVLVNVAIAWPLARAFGPPGIALALSLSAVLRLVLLTWRLGHRVPGLTAGLGWALARLGLAAVPAGLLAAVLADPAAQLTEPGDRSGPSLALALAILLTVGAVYLLTCWWLRVPETTSLVAATRGMVAQVRSGSR